MKKPNRIPLGAFPTPLHKLENISRALHTNVYIKRDDMTGVLLGGNKVRKLEYLLADAKDKGFSLVMTTGQAQSNHAALTAACALRLGMTPVLVLKKRGVCSLRGNQILNHLMGVRVVFVDTDSYDDIYREMDRLSAEMGRPAYKIPCGGSNALGTLGYVDCMREVSESGIPFTHVFSACGSGGTCAGILLGQKLYLPNAHVTACAVDTDPFDPILRRLVQEACDLLEIPPVDVEPDLIDMTAAGYSIPSKEGIEAMEMMLQMEGIVLDPCYTGKAFAGLLQRAREGAFTPEDHVLFIHTGGAGGLFAPDWEANPTLL